MNPAATIAKNIFSSRIFWLLVIVLLAVWLLGPRMKEFIRKLRTPDRGNYAGQAAPNAADQARLQELARRMREEIYTVLGWDERDIVAQQILAINDTELRYLAEFYAQIAQGNSLREDIEGEWSWNGEDKQRLIARLLQLNL